ncbi:MAG: TadE/TadG family type IV pilus assembly protein [Acidimicrobiia bacterium]
MRKLRQSGDEERGAALIEMALALPLLVLVLVGMAEFGVAFRDWLSITTATREGIRVGSAAGNDINADCLILEAAGGALVSVPVGNIQELWIFKADSNGNPTGQRNIYRPANPSDPPALLQCNGGWYSVSNNWPSVNRNVQTGNLDIMGVRVTFRHNWITQFGQWVGSEVWTDDAIMRLEPQVFGP